ncbi:hypothetical protein LDENG_00161460, partial [Lucifuga dentata]
TSRTSISPVLASLHWLPVKYRIDFKIVLYTYKAFHNQALAYICELLTLYSTGRTLRSSDQGLLTIPGSKLKTRGDCAFCCSGPQALKLHPQRYKMDRNCGLF